MNCRALTTRLTLALALAQSLSAAGPAHAVFGGVGDMFVTGDVSNTVRTYGGVSGSFIGLFGAPTNSPLAIDFGALNGRVLVGGFAGGVMEFDAATGAYIKTYGPPVWAWSGIYAPNGNVLVASSATDEIIEYDSNTGAFVQLFAPMPGQQPSDMRYGPNGNLYVCAYAGNMVWELDAVTGAVISSWSLPPGSRPNDVEFLNGEILVTALGTNRVFRYDSTPAHTFLGLFGDPSWGNLHGIEISPHNGHIYVVDGVTAQCYEFDPLTFALLNAAVLSPAPADKVVDIAFRVDDRPTPAISTTWGRIKSIYR
jgi:DNA-binding beta-propeller fold protein YncE